MQGWRVRSPDRADAIVYNRKKDLNAGLVTSALARKNPWYKDVVPNVSPGQSTALQCS